MIYMIRHGQTETNQAGQLQGRSDKPLNETGMEQARQAGAWFAARGIRFEKVYSSPLIRAVQTARLIVGEEAEIITDERLLEMDYGPYEGISLQKLPPEILHFFSDFVNHPAPEGMEPLTSVVGRLGDFLEDLKTEFRFPENESHMGHILISAHAIALKGALEYLTPDSRGSYWSKYIGNCAVYQTEILPDGSFTVPAPGDFCCKYTGYT